MSTLETVTPFQLLEGNYTPLQLLESGAHYIFVRCGNESLHLGYKWTPNCKFNVPFA